MPELPVWPFALLMFVVVPARAADQSDQSDQLPEILSAMKQIKREMANPEMQRSAAADVSASNSSQAEDDIKRRMIIERCAGP